MENGTEVKSTVLEDVFLLGRRRAIERANGVFDNQIQELCFRTRYPRELKPFLTACLARRGELNSGAGARTLFLKDKAAWQQISESEKSPKILVADAELDFESNRSELLKQSRVYGHSVIYAATAPRPDLPEIVDLPQAQKYEVEELLKKHGFAAGQAAALARQSNGEAYLLAQLLSGTSERREWAKGKAGYQLRHIALLGGWNDAAVPDKDAITQATGEAYDNWIKFLYPLTREPEPPLILEGGIFKPISRYDTWVQLGVYLTDADLMRFKDAATEILKVNDPRLDLPKDKRPYAGMARDLPPTTSGLLREGIAETLTLLAGQRDSLRTSAGLADYVAASVVSEVLNTLDWKRWATLSPVLPALAEAAPDNFLDALEQALNAGDASPIPQLFGQSEDPLFGRTYHTGVLWALEVLAWHADYLSRVTLCLARMVPLPLPANMANNALNSLTSIFLTWLPQTLATVERRYAAVKKLADEYPDTGWKLLMAILPETHQTGSYNPKPVWANWFDKAWTGQVTRHEMMRQIVNYSQLAVSAAVTDTNKLNELVKRWNHLPREAVDQILTYLTSAAFVGRPDAERFIVWEQLVNEVQKHRKYSQADWAMPEPELRKLEEAAAAIEPKSTIVRNQRLFDDYAHHFFESDDFDLEEKKLAQSRDNAVREIIASSGLDAVVDVAQRVKMPAELGEALGRIGDPKTDEFLLPAYLLSENIKLINLVRGYVWARYFTAGAKWAEALDVGDWTLKQQATFFSFLPFHAAVWRRAELVLGKDTAEYWKLIYPNPFQAKDDLEEAVKQAIKYGRGDIAVGAINSMRFNKQAISSVLALDAVKALLAHYEKGEHVEQHELLEAIKLLQTSKDIDIEELSKIEFQTLNLLDRFSGAAPVILEKRLASDPNFFHAMVTRAFRSEKISAEESAASGTKDELAGHVFRLLYRWQTPPGAIDNQTLNEDSLKGWIDQVEKLCKESGHWKIAQQLVGTAFVYAPLGVEGLLKHPTAAKILDRADLDDMRRGFTTGLFNLRGVHGYTAGKEELDLAKTYHEFAEKFDSEGFVQLATALRKLSDSYKRESEREARENPYGRK
jgi:hypothetical protein